MATTQYTIDKLNELFQKMDDLSKRTTAAEEELNNLRISNAEHLAKLQIDLLNKKARQELELQQEVFQKYLEDGGRMSAVLAREERRNKLRELEEQLQRELDGKSEAERTAIEAAAELRREALEREFEERLEHEVGLREELKKLDEAEAKAKRKQKAKEELEEKKKIKDRAKEAASAAQDALGGGDLSKIFRGKNIDAAMAELTAKGKSEEEAREIIRGAQANAVYNALAGFAKQLESTATDVAEAQSEIDTRLQGSKNDKSVFGSYWSRMSTHITGNIGISPFLKQADAVTNLKTLVGKGIAFNVEQRAFLDTISEKIATTFEATDASLLKLVRIQQADSTAARLGMESALTAFLNNMYETTEYMTEAADSIRASIYEASALMTAEEATDFEYQVQKWMGSLYSVGFQNTQGLSDALGKLAAGDIGGVTDGGFGNLLVMAANKANLSIAEILQDGLNDDETNALMHAMVEYLSGIYNETKDNKVVAQQFANVYGLTASDLKAAANLASSTTNVYKNNLNYGGMLGQLTDMANSMGSRTAMGTMVQNVFENLKYSTAASIGNDPVLYSTYMIASMLDDTVGGIAIPTIGAFAMGNGVEIDLETTIADIMRTGAMAGGLLGGIGKMIGGIAKGSGGGFSGSGMLKAFGVNLDSSSAATLVRGDGAGLAVTSSGMDTSYSGYLGNEDGNAVKDKMLTDAKDEANQQAIQALEEAQEIGLANVDEHVVQIYRILEDVITGSRNLHVTFGGPDSTSWSNNNGYTPSGVPML
jgi:hypothetical protein